MSVEMRSDLRNRPKNLLVAKTPSANPLPQPSKWADISSIEAKSSLTMSSPEVQATDGSIELHSDSDSDIEDYLLPDARASLPSVHDTDNFRL